MTRSAWLARNLAAALLSGPWTEKALIRRSYMALGHRNRRAQRSLIAELLVAKPVAFHDSPRALEDALAASAHFKAAIRAGCSREAHLSPVLEPARFSPVPVLRELDVPRLATPGDLAVWLGISPPRMDWLADKIRQHSHTAIPILQNYTYAFIPKRGGRQRLLEAPKPELKAIQRRILTEILNRLPTHDAAHGFVVGRSCLTGAGPHVGQEIVVTVDLVDFFPSTPIGRVHRTFRSLGYPWAVACLLTSLTTTATPLPIRQRLKRKSGATWHEIKRLAAAHLPQGAPTSPALANLAAWRLDRRLTGLSASFGATYTRYADDLAFSGPRSFARGLEDFMSAAADIVEDEGYAVNVTKTRIMPRSSRQSVTGVLVNHHLNLPRDEFDTLKAILHNCIVKGPYGENRASHPDFRAHLEGRVEWFENVNAGKGKKLRQLINRIRW